MEPKSYFHTTVCGPSVEAFRLVFVSAVAYAIRNKIASVALAVHAKGNLENVISDAIGDDVVKRIQKRPVAVYEGLALGLMTERISVPFSGGTVFIAAHTSTDYTKKLEANARCKALFFAPWQELELSEFLRRHPSMEIRADV